MAIISRVRLNQVTGSYATGSNINLRISDQLPAAGTGSFAELKGNDALSHLASAIKRIHNHDSFSEAAPGVFNITLQPLTDANRDLGASSKNWAQLHGRALQSAAGLDIDALAGSVTIDAAGTGAGVSIGGKGNSDLTVDPNDSGNYTIGIQGANAGSGKVALDIDADGLLTMDGAQGIKIGNTAQSSVQVGATAFAVTGSGAVSLVSTTGGVAIEAKGSSQKLLLNDGFIESNAIVVGGGIHLSDSASEVTSFKSNFVGITSILGALNSAAGNLGEVNSYVRPGAGSLPLAVMKGGVQVIFSGGMADGTTMTIGAYGSSGVANVTFTARSSSASGDEFLVGSSATDQNTKFAAMVLASSEVKAVNSVAANSSVILFTNATNSTSLPSLSLPSGVSSLFYTFADSSAPSAQANKNFTPASGEEIDLSALSVAEMTSKVDIYLNGQLLHHDMAGLPVGEVDVSLERITSPANVSFNFAYELAPDDRVTVKVR